MAITKSYRSIFAVSLGCLLTLNLGAIPGLANASGQSDNIPSQGLPGRRLGGGTRGPEVSGYTPQMPLIALVPETNLGVTTAAYPRFLFYLPNAEGIRKVEYVLRNEADELVYDTTVSVDSRSGIFSIDLASVEGLEPLQVDENYRWYFSIIADDRAQDISVDGWTRRVDLHTWIEEQTLTPDLAVRLSTAPPLEKAQLLYQEAHLWHDAALILEDLHQANPNNQTIAKEWFSLLEAVNLTELNAASTVRVSTVTTTQ
ncbi:MAG: DUF928 domain-containing protein [Cyanobacteria bacterium P01_D01_bin.156]